MIYHKQIELENSDGDETVLGETDTAPSRGRAIGENDCRLRLPHLRDMLKNSFIAEGRK